MDKSFAGFERSNTTPIPDILFDELLTELSGAELKVLLYIMRRTWGFKKDADAISISQFQYGIVTHADVRLDSGCGIKRRETIIQALSSLEKGGYIVSRKTKADAGDNAVTVYTIRFKEVVSKPDHPNTEGGFKTGPQMVSKPDYRGFKTGLPVVAEADYRSPVSGPPVVSKPDPQYTDKQETGLQETDKQNNIYSSSQTPNQFGLNSKPALTERIEHDSQSSKKAKRSQVSPEVKTLIAEWRQCHEDFYHERAEKKAFRVNQTMIDHAACLIYLGLTPQTLSTIVGAMLAADKSDWYGSNGLHLGSVVNWVEKHGVPSTRPPEDDADALYYDLACKLGDHTRVDLPSGLNAWTNREFLQVVYGLLYPEGGEVSHEMRANALAMMRGYLQITRKASA
jgi:hypothetical protein